MGKDMMKMHGEMYGKHMKHKGLIILILGVLILVNAYYAVVGWAIFIGAILVVAGLLKLVIPHKPCC